LTTSAVDKMPRADAGTCLSFEGEAGVAMPLCPFPVQFPGVTFPATWGQFI
jgi:hypothetical protein